MRLLSLLAGLCLCICALAQSPPLTNDPNLAKPVTMRLKIASLSEFCKQLTKDTGAMVYVAPNIAERKITAIFKDRPASEAMEMVAKTFFCEWVSDSGGYRLSMPRDSQNEEIGMVEAEQKAVRECIASLVQRVTAIAERPKEIQTEERDRILAEIEKLRTARDAESKKKLDALRKDYSLYSAVAYWDLGFALRADPSAADELTQGVTLWASTKRGEALPLPESSIPTFVSNVMIPSADGGPPKFERRSPTGAVAAIRCNFITGMLDMRSVATGLGPTAAGFTTRNIPILDSGEAEGKLYNLPLRKRIRTWVRTEDPAVMALPIAPPKTAPPSAGYLATAYSMAEHLEFLADNAGVPIIADAFRLPASMESFFPATTVGEYVRQLQSQTMAEVRGSYFRTEHGWLLMKHARYWRQLPAEIPESAFAKMEGNNGGLSLDDYATYAVSLSPEQAAAFPYRPPLTRFPRLPLMKGMHGLRLWGSLALEQKRAAYETGLAFSALGGSERDLYRVALNELLWTSTLNETFLPVLMHGVDPGSQIGFFMRDSGNGVEAVMNNNQESLIRTQPVSKTAADVAAEDAALRARAVSFLFGSNPATTAAYNIILPPSK